MSIPSVSFDRPEGVTLSEERTSLVENLILTMSSYARIGQSGQIWEAPGVVAVYSGRAGAIFNAVMLTRPTTSEESLQKLLQWVHQRYVAKGARWSLWLVEHFLPPELLARMGRVLAPYGLAVQSRNSGMVAYSLQEPVRSLPFLDTQAVLSAATRYDFCFVMSQAFSTALPTYVDAYQAAAYWQGPLRGFVGYHEGQAISSACYTASRDAVGLYGVATLPRFQRKGFGESLIRRTLDFAQKESGCARMVLEASERGARLYQRLGFRTITHVSVYNEAS